MSIFPRIGLGAFLAVACVVGRAGEAPPKPAEVYGAWSFYNNMGWGAYYRGDLELARDRFTHAIEYIRPYQKEYPRLMSRSCHDLTRVLCAVGRYSDAEPLARWVVEARDHDSRTRDDVMFDSLYLLAFVYRETDRPADAVPILRRAVALEEKFLGPNDGRLALTLKELADAEARSGALAEADANYRRAAAIHKAANLDLADTLSARAEVLEKLGRSNQASLLRGEADEMLKDAAGLSRLADHFSNPLAVNQVRRGSR
ncbi:tetratricopeptide repeat protein [Paludisphaera sp.]|uniref:tetratricopeptide repeat protein n=1 Tax=Paludisphaera sp. TaxID=2017432 RepID=UPI00301BD8EA